MNAPSPLRLRRTAGLPLALLLACLTAATAMAGELRIEATLIWGTDEAKSPNPKHKPVQDDLSKKLKKFFKWKHYFEVNRQQVTIPTRTAKRIRMSDKCEIEIVELEGPKIEVKLIGEGKPVNKTTQTLSKGESFIYSGSDKNDCSWSVLIKLLDEK